MFHSCFSGLHEGCRRTHRSFQHYALLINLKTPVVNPSITRHIFVYIN
ncbi:hypothetical protein ABI_43210 [Asticcacaulis biprosthecium C19]|uniref:Uncharacterized protein n=1 Tax=Asticcacaulis biprosthecium C19 TaxID=715226 RepID=F4QT27_9CAUL|nr:hypothetical protein ABI_43210 [Asticcacaulis biprosthecium C19]